MSVLKFCGGWKVPLLLPNSTLTLLLRKLTTTRSGRPSPLTSATAAEDGESPAATLCAAWKVPVPGGAQVVEQHGHNGWRTCLAVIRSGCPSPLTSATAGRTRHRS